MHKSKPQDGFNTKTVNESIDSMASEIEKSIGENAHVKMRRSRVETAIHIVLRGNPEETETQIQKIHDSLVSSAATSTSLPTTDYVTESVVEETVTSDTYTNPFEPFSPREY